MVHGKCIKRFVVIVDKKHLYHLSRLKEDRFIVKNVIVPMQLKDISGLKKDGDFNDEELFKKSGNRYRSV